MAGGKQRRGAPAARPRGVRTPKTSQGAGRTTPAKPIQPLQPIQAMGTPQGVQYNAFLRGAARDAGMMKGQPTLAQKPKGFKAGPGKLGRKLGKAVMAKGELSGGVGTGGTFNPRGGRH